MPKHTGYGHWSHSDQYAVYPLRIDESFQGTEHVVVETCHLGSYLTHRLHGWGPAGLKILGTVGFGELLALMREEMDART